MYNISMVERHLAVQKHESLRGFSPEMTFGLATSPGGRPCIGMSFKGREWILFQVTTSSVMVNELGLAEMWLDGQGVDSLRGQAFDIQASIKEKKLVLISPDSMSRQPRLGIYVPSEHFDEVMDQIQRPDL